MYDRFYQHVRTASRRLGLGRFLLRRVIQPSQRLADLRFPDHESTVNADGHRLAIFSPRRNRIGRALYREGIWEADVTKVITRCTATGMVAVDVGADIGYYTLLLARAVGPSGTVIAFEPIPDARRLLEQNIRTNNYRNVRVSSFGLATVEGESVLEAPLERSRLAMGKAEPSAGDLVVKLRRFDDLRNDIGVHRIDIVKIDVEGAEHEVLQGMTATLRADRPILIIEVHHEMLPLFGSTTVAFLSWLGDLGYEYRPIGLPTPDVSDSTTTYCCYTEDRKQQVALL
jgi:FkbM family methyltransferase